MATKKKSKKRGRKPDASSKSGKIRELLKTGMKPADIAKKVGCTPALVYNVKARASGGATKTRSKKAGRKAPASRTKAVAGDDLDAVLTAVKQSEQDRVALRRALERIESIVADALK